MNETSIREKLQPYKYPLIIALSGVGIALLSKKISRTISPFTKQIPLIKNLKVAKDHSRNQIIALKNIKVTNEHKSAYMGAISALG
jgi:hypothetical protein